jgi:hypothetical protein
MRALVAARRRDVSDGRVRTVNRAVRFLIVALMLTIGVAVGTAARASAVEGARIASSTVYRFDPDAPAVTVEATYTMTNESPDVDLGDGRSEYYFFTGLYAPVELGAVDLAVLVDGRDGDYSIELDEDGYPYLDVEFGYELRYGETATVTTRYTLLGDPPRTIDSVARINAAYASFPVYGWGDAGAVDVRVEVPASWDIDYVGGDLTRVPSDAVDAYEASGVDPDEFLVWFTARDDSKLERTTLEVDGRGFDVLAWPGDVAWRDFVTTQITSGIPVLEDLVGHDWPVDGTTDVIEASTGYLRGYAGFYDPLTDEIEAGEELDQLTMLHELSHAWFNWLRFDDRFIVEGLAEETSARAVALLGGELSAPRTDDEIRTDWGEFSPFPLIAWADLAEDSIDDAAEDYGYAASHRVVRALWEEVGDDAMGALLAAAVEGARAYPDERGVAATGDPVGWREFLDLAEQVAGSSRLRDAYVMGVLDEDGVDELELRDQLVERYDELAARGDTWWPTVQVRDAMAAWQLTTAAANIEVADELLDLRDELRAVLDDVELHETAGIEAQYQDVDGPSAADAARSELGRMIDAAEELAVNRRALTARLDALDQDVPELAQRDYDTDPIGIASSTAALADDARELGSVHAELTALLDSSDLRVPPLEPTAFVDDPDDAIDLVERQVDAATVVVGAHDARDEASSLLERIGGFRSDVDRRLAEADRLLANGDLDAAEAASREVIAEIDDLDRAGAERVVWIGGTILLLTAAAAVLVARRRRSTPTDDADDHENHDAVGSPLDGQSAPQPISSPFAPPTGEPTADVTSGADRDADGPGQPT